MRKIFCVYTSYGETNLDSGLAHIERIVRRWNAKLTYIAVENQWSSNVTMSAPMGSRVIAGDNSLREFSGYEKGFHALIQSRMLGATDIILFANDTFDRNYGSDYLDLFDWGFIENSLAQPGLVGWVDQYPELVEIFGHSHRSWIRTSFFLGRAKDFAEIFPLGTFIQSLDIFSHDMQEFFIKDDRRLSENFKAFNRTWLLGTEHESFKENWHSIEKAKEHGLAYLQQKMKCIMAEHLVSLRAKSLGLSLADVRSRSLFRV